MKGANKNAWLRASAAELEVQADRILAANALDAAACRKIFRAKGRPATDPLIVHLASVGDLAGVAVPNSAAYRLAAAYDVFGNGKTAVKVSAARGVAGETIATAAALNPGSSFATSTAINVTDSNHNNIPDCNLLNPAANGECGALANAAFGSVRPGREIDPEILKTYEKLGIPLREVAVLEGVDDTVPFIAHMMGIDAYNMSDEDWAKVQAKLKELIGQVRFVSSDDTISTPAAMDDRSNDSASRTTSASCTGARSAVSDRLRSRI